MDRETLRRRIVPVAGGLGGVLVAREVLARAREADLRGQVALITGGSRGLGLELARRLADEGCRLAICARDEAELQRAGEELGQRGAEVLAVRCNIADQDDVARMVAAVEANFGRIDLLICNAGVIQVGQLESMELADFRQAMDIMYWGALYPILAALPGMRARRAGRIAVVTSIGGKISVPHLLPYSASKFAAVGFSQGLRAEVASEGIKVVTVCPGLMRTGSPRNTIFRGQHRSEYAWFSISDALPGLSISAESAARRIVAACRRGDAEVLFPLPAKVASVVNAVAPGLTAGVLATVDRLLPEDDARSGRRKGADSQSWLSPSWITRLGDRAARKYNQIAPNEGATA